MITRDDNGKLPEAEVRAFWQTFKDGREPDMYAVRLVACAFGVEVAEAEARARELGLIGNA